MFEDLSGFDRYQAIIRDMAESCPVIIPNATAVLLSCNFGTANVQSLHTTSQELHMNVDRAKVYRKFREHMLLGVNCLDSRRREAPGNANDAFSRSEACRTGEMTATGQSLLNP